jgi:hypothetical protein
MSQMRLSSGARHSVCCNCGKYRSRGLQTCSRSSGRKGQSCHHAPGQQSDRPQTSGVGAGSTREVYAGRRFPNAQLCRSRPTPTLLHHDLGGSGWYSVHDYLQAARTVLLSSRHVEMS